MSRTPASRLRLAAAVACIALSGSAAGALDFPALIGQADTASDATVYLVPPMALFRMALDEPRMQSASCRYTTTDPAAIRALVGLLRASDISGNEVYQRPDVREGIYLTLADGTQFKLLLQDNFGGKLPVRGVAETSNGGDLHTVSVTTKSTLATAVREWAATRGGAGTGSACSRQSAVAGPTAPPEMIAPPR
ncbi:MAG: hypothetical protein ABI277_15345 [Burkholderiaceae bacterium]